MIWRWTEESKSERERERDGKMANEEARTTTVCKPKVSNLRSVLRQL